jgi:hypothetical protein
MKKILLLAAIYSLIVNQCCKKAQKGTLNKTQQEKMTGVGTLSGELDQQHILSHDLIYKDVGLMNNSNTRAYTKESKKEP